MLAVDAKRELADNRAMPVAGQARYPDSVLCRFLDRCLPQRAVVAEDWVTRAASAPWTPVYLPDAESRQRLGLAAEMRIGLDLGDAPAYVDLLSFLPPAEYSALLSAAGFSPDESPVAATGTAHPLLFDWRRVHRPVRRDDDHALPWPRALKQQLPGDPLQRRLRVVSRGVVFHGQQRQRRADLLVLIVSRRCSVSGLMSHPAPCRRRS